MRWVTLPYPYFVVPIDNESRRNSTFVVKLNSRFARESTPVPLLPQVSFYLSNYTEQSFTKTQHGLVTLASQLGIEDLYSSEQRTGSWWQLFRGRLKQAQGSDFVQKKMAEIDLAVSLAIVEKRRADVDAVNAKSARELMEGLQAADAGCAHAGFNLVVKYVAANGASVILSRHLAVLEVKALEQNPGITADPSSAFQLLALAVQSFASAEDEGPPVLPQ